MREGKVGEWEMEVHFICIVVQNSDQTLIISLVDTISFFMRVYVCFELYLAWSS